MLTLIETFTVTKSFPNSRSRKVHTSTLGRFRCHCGKEVVRSPGMARKRPSCGCGISHNKTHGLKHHPLYSVWRGMRKRCYLPTSQSYDHYGGRGITVCSEWREAFEPFYAWAIGAGWQPGLEIDRRNNNGNYEPSNCRFVNEFVQARNRSNAKLTAAQATEIRTRRSGGETLTALAAEFGVSFSLISQIARNRTWKESSL